MNFLRVFSRGLIIAMVLIGIIWALLFAFITQTYETYKAAYTLSEARELESVLQGTAKTYEDFSLHIVERLLRRPDALEIVSGAYEAEDSRKDSFRGQLYELLKEDYASLQAHGFWHLQFHFPDNESFLLFSQPEEVGDGAVTRRETVTIANRDARYVSGFEAGGGFSGYRFVYPLHDGDRHIGSVELGVPLYSCIDKLGSAYRGCTIFFMMDKEIIGGTVPIQYQASYSPSLISRDYLIERKVYINILNNDAYLPSDNRSFIGQIQQKAKDRLGDNEIISFCLPADGRNHIVSFLPIENAARELTGYIVAVYEDENIEAIDGQMRLMVILLSVMAVMVLVFAFVFVWDKSRIYKMAMTDSLTNISGKRDFYVVAKKEFSRSLRNNKNLCLLMIDIDHFKNVNDTYGHQAGDNVLKILVKIVSQALRQSDYFARWGGEEFVVLLEDTDKYSGCLIAERIRRAVETHVFEEAGRVTVSIGVAVLTPEDKTIDSLIRRADDALYQAKKEGRNRISIGGDAS